MARDQEIIDVREGEWTELTNADADKVTYRVESGEVKLRVGSSSPPNADRKSVV